MKRKKLLKLNRKLDELFYLGDIIVHRKFIFFSLSFFKTVGQSVDREIYHENKTHKLKKNFFTSVIVWKLLWTPLVLALLTCIWNQAIAIGTIIINTFFIHEHWKHFQCFHKNICTVVINVLLIFLSLFTSSFIFDYSYFVYIHALLQTKLVSPSCE